MLNRFRVCGRVPWPAWLLLLAAAYADVSPGAQDAEFEPFDDRPLQEPLSHPDWFKLSFLDLADDLREVVDSGKQGLIVYFGQKYCAYCKALLEVDFGKEDILEYTQRHFDVIGIDIHGDRTVTDPFGHQMSERAYSARMGVNFTPTLVFYDRTGREALRLRGYYPPYRFRAALEYVADGHYRRETFQNYLARADVPLVFEAGDLNYDDFFLPPPLMLDRSRWPGERPLIVFFEQGNCHACDVLHCGPLQDPEVRRRLARFDMVQVPFWSADTPVITPEGKQTTAREWSRDLGLFYTPTLIFYDRQGREIVRVDSVIQFYRLRNVLDYVLTGGFLEYPSFQRWSDSGLPVMPYE
jgi:thioredoxin-related protein